MENSDFKQYKSLNRLNSPAPQRVYNPLYDGRNADSSPVKFNRMYLVPLMCLIAWLYVRNENRKAIIEEPKLSRAEKIRNNRVILDENDVPIGIAGEISDPRIYNNPNALPTDYDINSVKKTDALADAHAVKKNNFNRKRPVVSAFLNGMDSVNNKLVFAGSFINKDNAERVLTRLKSIGYDKAEIIMKEKLPYKVVVTGFYNHDNSAKAEVRSLEKRGIDVYAATKNLEEIYRNLKK
jgi:hypothetical protein